MSRFYEHIDESIWSDMQDRSAGDKIRREDDVNLMDKDTLYDYIMSTYGDMCISVNNTLDEYILIMIVKSYGLSLHYKNSKIDKILSDGFDFGDSSEFNTKFKIVKEEKSIYEIFNLDGTVTNKTALDFIEFYYKNVIEDKEFDLLKKLIKEFVNSSDEYSLDSFCDYIKTKKSLTVDNIMGRLIYFIKNNEDFYSDEINKVTKDINESIWSDMQDRSAGEKIRKEDEMTQDDFDAVDDFIFGFAARVVWDGMRDSLTNFLKYIDENPEALDCDITRVKKYVEDNWHKSICDDVEASIEQEEREKQQDMNESIWSDMQDRSTGDTVRKEEDLSLKDKDFLKRHTFRNFAKKIVYYESSSNTLSDFEHFVRNNSIFNVVVDGKKPYVDYVKRNWDKGDDIHSFINDTIEQINKQISMMGFKKVPGETIEETLNNWWKSLDYDVKDEMMRDTNRDLDPDDRYTDPEDMWDDTDIETKMDIYLDKNKVGNLKESIWSDMQDRSTGENKRKEDEVLTDVENSVLKKTGKMFQNAVRTSKFENNPSDRFKDTKEDFIRFILRRKKELFWTKFPREGYDRIINYTDKNWGDCSGIDDFLADKFFECDGVPGGLTPVDVGGMGPAYFPGPNGEPGSGDLPSPTGIVYKQVAPFDTFIKMKRPKKNKKKKFRKEDEPCVHSPNAKVYDYVDDFRDYVDRTYNNIDKMK